MAEEYIAEQPRGAEGYVELSRTKQGVLFEKELLREGKLKHPDAPGGELNIDDAFLDTMVTNFTNQVADIVQATVVGADNKHTEDPRDNIGEVIGLKRKGKSLYATIDVRDEDAAKKLGKTMLGISAGFSTNYTDTSTGKQVGPTLYHTAITNRPYVTKLSDYEQVMQLSADSADRVVLLTPPETTPEETVMPTKDELIAALRDEHKIDVNALISERDTAVSLSNTLRDEIVNKLGSATNIELSNGGSASGDQLVGAIAEAGSKLTAQEGQLVTLSGQVENLVNAGLRRDAEAEVDSLIRDRKIFPYDRDARIELKLSAPELFTKMIPANPVVSEEVEIGLSQGAVATEAATSAEQLGAEFARKYAFRSKKASA